MSQHNSRQLSPHLDHGDRRLTSLQSTQNQACLNRPGATGDELKAVVHRGHLPCALSTKPDPAPGVLQLVQAAVAAWPPWLSPPAAPSSPVPEPQYNLLPGLVLHRQFHTGENIDTSDFGSADCCTTRVLHMSSMWTSLLVSPSMLQMRVWSSGTACLLCICTILALLLHAS